MWNVIYTSSCEKNFCQTGQEGDKRLQGWEWGRSSVPVYNDAVFSVIIMTFSVHAAV